MIMVLLRPIFSAKGKAKSAPKKQPAWLYQHLILAYKQRSTYLEGRNDVALSGIPLSLGHATHVEVTLEGSERHSTTNDCRVVAHYCLVRP
jgi:hypothetical protein